jgi:hypothetical protein
MHHRATPERGCARATLPTAGVLLVFAHVLHRHPFTLVAAARAGDASPAVVVHHQLIRAAPWDRVEGRGKGTKQYSVEC